MPVASQLLCRLPTALVDLLLDRAEGLIGGAADGADHSRAALQDSIKIFPDKPLLQLD